MQDEQPKKNPNQTDYNFNLKVIIALIAIEVMILVFISFVKIYIDKKISVLDRMRDEVQILEKIFLDDIDYSSYVLEQMSDLIKTNYRSNSRIDNILAHYSLNINDKNFFGWRGFYWLDKNSIVRNTNEDCTMAIGSNLSYLSNVRLSKIHPGKVFSSQNPNLKKDFTPYLDLAIGVNNDEGEYIGTILLEIETSTILEDIEMYRSNNFTEFLILDSRMNVITSYPINSNRMNPHGQMISYSRLIDKIREINFFSENAKEISDIRMFSGVNFLAKKIKDKPYLLIVSLDPVHVKTTFTKKVALKFLEILVLASFFLVIVLMIYKRETWLRSKAERASSLATKAMIAKSDFLSYTAHEIRSPLGFILTGSEIMSKKLFGPIPEKYEDYVSGIYHNSKLILDFINDILDEKHLASGNFKLEEDVFDIEQIVKKAIQTNQTRFHSRKIEIKANIQQGLPYLLGDARKILQTLSNLISNSYKYSLDNTIITVEVKMAGKKLKMSVQDQGIGMSEDEIKIALTKYGTVHGSKPGNFIESYGLGLPIVKMLTDAHDAKLHISSAVGTGTNVTITFPSKRIVEKLESKKSKEK